MGRLQFKDNEDEHNSYQSYTDLMSGFRIVFMIASVIAIVIYRDAIKWREEHEGIVNFIESTLNDEGGSGLDITEGDIQISLELYKAMNELRKAQEQINNKYIEYDSEHNMFRVKKHVEFEENRAIIPEKDKEDLIEIGRAIQSVVSNFKGNDYIGFKIIIDGRIGEGEKEKIPNSQRNLSYNRANNLRILWKDNDILKGDNVIVAGSGLEGEGRVSGKNRTFVIQVVPYIKTNLKSKKDEDS
jgi:hypothetical protein